MRDTDPWPFVKHSRVAEPGGLAVIQTERSFPPEVVEKLAAYVYELRDPVDGTTFYVGKGRGNRVFAHAADALASDDADETPNAKFERIREIRRRDLDVDVRIVRHGLTDSEAFAVEAALIERLGFDDLLVNLVHGHRRDRGLMSADDVVALYAAAPAPPFDPDLQAVMFRIPALWYPAMDPADLFEATRGWWIMGKRCQVARYAFAVNKGVIREVYEVTRWRTRADGDRDYAKDLGKKTRWGFDGVVAGPEMDRYRHRGVRAMFARGSANPVLYINC
jgi:uncharacterized protein